MVVSEQVVLGMGTPSTRILLLGRQKERMPLGLLWAGLVAVDPKLKTARGGGQAKLGRRRRWQQWAEIAGLEASDAFWALGMSLSLSGRLS